MRTIFNTQEIFKNSYYVQHDNAIMEIVFFVVVVVVQRIRSFNVFFSTILRALRVP